jgi:hypothetical protein
LEERNIIFVLFSVEVFEFLKQFVAHFSGLGGGA